MKLTTPFALLAAVSGAYSLIIQRDAYADLKKVIKDISGSLGSFGLAAQSWNGGDILPLLDYTEDLIKLMVDGQAVVDNADPIGLGDVTSLFWSVRNLNLRLQDNFHILVSHVRHVEKAQACDIVHEKLVTINTNGNILIDAFLSKVSTDFAKELAKTYTDDMKRIMQDAQNLFSQTSCYNQVDDGAMLT